MKLVEGHPDRMGYFYRFPHACPGYVECSINRYIKRRNRLGLKRSYTRRVVRQPRTKILVDRQKGEA